MPGIRHHSQEYKLMIPELFSKHCKHFKVFICEQVGEMVQQLGALVFLLETIWGRGPSTFHGGSHACNSVPGIAIPTQAPGTHTVHIHVQTLIVQAKHTHQNK